MIRVKDNIVGCMLVLQQSKLDFMVIEDIQICRVDVTVDLFVEVEQMLDDLGGYLDYKELVEFRSFLLIVCDHLFDGELLQTLFRSKTVSIITQCLNKLSKSRAPFTFLQMRLSFDNQVL